MINRENWKLVNKHLDYLSDVKQLESATVSSVRVSLRHLLEWADQTPFAAAPRIRPTFPRYVSDRLMPGSAQLVCGHARRFFEWLRLTSKKNKAITELWIETISRPRQPSEIKQYDEYTLPDVRAMISLPQDSLGMQRDQAAVALLFLSGMRIGAFSTMPIKSVDLAGMSVRQWPEWGVRTKCGKKATTFLLDIPDLLAVCSRWDTFVRAQLPDDALWYASINSACTHLKSRPSETDRRRYIERGLARMCALVEIQYRSPHSLRHGFAVYGLKTARDLADMEAVSKNLMHASLKTTLEVYAVLGQADVKARITGLGHR